MNQVLQWNGDSWICSNAGAGTVTLVNSGTGLTGGPITGTGTLSIAPNACASGNALTGLPFACAPFASLSANTFNGNQTVDGSLTVASNSYQPFLVQSSSTFGTWLELSNTSTGGHTWNILSAGGGNAEGAGNIGITDLTGRSTIWLEGNVNTSSVNATGTVGGAQGLFSGTGTFGVEGMTSNSGGAGVMGVSSTNFGVEGDSSAAAGIGVLGAETAASGTNYGVFGEVSSPNAIGVAGLSTSLNGGFGVIGKDQAGIETPETVQSAGVYGVHEGNSVTFSGLPTNAAGVWGDTSDGNQAGVLGTADNGNAIIAFNNSTDLGTITAYNFEASQQYTPVVGGASAYGGFCDILANGQIECNGSIVVNVATENFRRVQLYSVQSPEHWFEDFGSGTISDGLATVYLEPIFGQTVNTDMEYHVFLTPKGDCNGLYVSNETSTGFEVHELGGGRSNIAFDYRIVARRKGHESERLADVTDAPRAQFFKKGLGPNRKQISAPLLEPVHRVAQTTELPGSTKRSR